MLRHQYFVGPPLCCYHRFNSEWHAINNIFNRDFWNCFPRVFDIAPKLQKVCGFSFSIAQVSFYFSPEVLNRVEIRTLGWPRENAQPFLFAKCACNLGFVWRGVILLKQSIVSWIHAFQGRCSVLSEYLNMGTSSYRTLKRHNWPDPFLREASPVHLIGTVLHRRQNTRIRPFLPWFSPHSTVAALLKLGKSGFIAPQHLSPIAFRPMAALHAPREARFHVLL